MGVPFALSLEELDPLLSSEEVASWSPDDFLTVASRLGRDHGPDLLMLVGDDLQIDTLSAAVSYVWSMVEYPDAVLGHDTWRYWWNESGFTRDGVPAERPTEPMRLYRGAVVEPAHRRLDWSWTDDRAIAERFASSGLRGRPQGVVWTALVPPDHLLGFISDRDESEWVVDTEGLEIHAALPMATTS